MSRDIADRSDQRPPAIFVMGPTASGKTALALALSERLRCALVSVDSAQVYRGLDVGSAKPDAATRAQFPHALIDIREPEQSYSAADFRRDALAAMAAATDERRLPVLVGGTGLYFRALELGLSDLPDADPDTRAVIERQAQRLGWRAMHGRLALADPAAAGRIHPNDPQRIQRALEVIALTGRPLSAQQGGRGQRLPYRVLKLVVAPPDRAVLHERIAQRFRDMLEAGLVDEVRGLRARPGLTPGHASMRAVGYRQSWEYLDGDYGLDGLIERGIAATRQLAKRQFTWLRGEHDALWLDPDDGGRRAHAIRLVEEFARR